MVRAAAASLSRCVATAFAIAALTVGRPMPTLADGFDEALRLCPSERVTCVSSYDAGHFVEPWEYDGPLAEAVRSVSEVAERLGGRVVQDGSSAAGTALRVSFPSAKDEAIFWFPVDDALVQFRSERVDGSLWDGAANKVRIDRMRKTLGYAPAPMVRNRRALPSERMPDGNYKLQEERPYKRQDGAFYGEQGGGESQPLASLGSPEAARRLLFPFGRLGGRSSPVQAVVDDLSDLAALSTQPQ